jgi:hypothetical protein
MNPAHQYLVGRNRQLEAEVVKLKVDKIQAANGRLAVVARFKAEQRELNEARGLAESREKTHQVEIAELRGRNSYLRESVAGFKDEQVRLREQTQEMLNSKLEENNGLYREQRRLHEEVKTINRENKSLHNDITAELLTIGKLDAGYKRVYRENTCLRISMDECETELMALKDEIKKIHMTKTAEALHFECANLRLERDKLIVARDHAEARAEMWKKDIESYAKQYQTALSRLRAEEARNAELQRRFEAEIKSAKNHAHGNGWTEGYRVAEGSERVERLQKEKVELCRKENNLKGVIQDLTLENAALQRRLKALQAEDTLLVAQRKISDSWAKFL